MKAKSTVPLTLAALLVLNSATALGQSASEQKSSGIEFNGYFDLYYQMSPQSHSAVTTPPPTSGPKVLEGRAFDRLSDQLVLNMVEISAKKKTGKFSYQLDAAFGEMVDVLANNGPQPGAMGAVSPNPAANDPTRNVTQAIVSYTGVENLALAAGKFYTHMGYEGAKAKDNWQYSRSYSYNYAVPFTHQGAKATYAILPGKVGATFHLVNGWDSRIGQDSNRSPAPGATINFTPIENLSINYNFITDPEAGAGNGARTAHEANAAYTIVPKLSVAVDWVAGEQKKVSGGADAKWSGLVFYLKAPLTSWYTLSPRYELYDDSDGGFSTGTRQKLTALTVSNNFDLGDGFEARLEYRTDKSDQSTYFKTNDGGTTDRQDSYTAALLYSF